MRILLTNMAARIGMRIIDTSVLKNCFRTFIFNSQSKTTRTISNLSSCRYCQVKTYNELERNENPMEQKPPKLLKEFVNRNPRNPEYFGLNKPRGYSTQYDRRDFYNKLTILISNRHTTATVQHNSGVILASATTKEFLITKHLYKTTDISAARNIGRVLAQRCVEAGLTRVAWYPGRERRKLKVKAFLKAVQKGGIVLSEPRRVNPMESFYPKSKPKTKRKKWKKIPDSAKRKL